MVWSRGNALGIFAHAAERRMIMTEFISRNYGNEGYEIIIKTDSHEHYRATEDFARRLIDHAKPMRNADKIRAMNDEELADLINREIGYCAPTGDCEKMSNDCKACWLDWLKQSAEEGER